MPPEVIISGAAFATLVVLTKLSNPKNLRRELADKLIKENQYCF